MKRLLGNSSSYLRWFHSRRQLATSPAAIITETLTKKVGAGVGEAATTSAFTPPKLSLKEKFRQFWKSLLEDYRDVAVETWNDAKARPGKASVYLGILSGALYCWKTNPTEYSYIAELTKYDTEVSFVSPAIRNPYAENYAQVLLKQKMKGELRYQSFELFSVIWRHDADKKVGIFEAKCNYLKPMWKEVMDRFVDVGVAGKWWMLERNMVDYDVNPGEWEKEMRVLEEDKREREKEEDGKS